VLDSHAIIHLGAHGALEWLPGKAVALSDTCVPQALIAGTPVIYPYIVNNPGEAACAKRRLGAVTIGHLTPPLRTAGLHGDTAELERLIDEYAAADGLDRRRAAMLRTTILQRAEDLGLLTEAGATRSDPTEALACLDAYLCDVKDLQIRDGLHIFGRAPAPEHRAHLLEALQKACPTANPLTLEHALDRSPAAEAHALITALDAHFVPPGPAGAPTRGRADVLPTGRNLTTSDPRGMPTRAAVTLAERAAADLLRRHRQDHGENPRSVVIDLWGSASLRTGGEDLALGLILLGAKPIWDAGSNRVTGIEILPLATLDRPRVDVTLRVSGLFRDAFETQIALFDSAVRAIATRDEAIDWNPLVAATTREATARVFGAAEGSYGAGADRLARGTWTTPAELGADYLQASATAYGQGLDGIALPDAFAARVATADAFVHQQDHREIDLLDGATHAAHEGGFAAAATALGATPALYHADTSNPEAPRTRTLAEELARVVRGRAANPVWIAGQMRHGYRGAAEIARTVEGLSAFAATLPARLDAQFDLLFAATLGTPEVEAFLARENPAAHADMQRRFEDARQRGLWRTPRNDLTSGALS
jgi:cobaltochelatase CobN